MPQRHLNRFGVVLDLLIASRYAAVRPLLQAIGERPTYKKIGAIRCWRQGRTYPRFARYINIVKKIENHFELEAGRLTKLIRGSSSSFFDDAKNKNPARFQLIREHLPQDFDIKSEAEKQEIVEWISTNVMAGATEYRKYQMEKVRRKFAIVFPSLPRGLGGGGWVRHGAKRSARYQTIPASVRLSGEMEDLLKFKTAALPPKGYQRRKRWQETTAKSQIKRHGLVLGVLAQPRDGELHGLGIPMSDLTFGLFAFPELWEWYLSWYLKRRGFFSSAELNILYELKSHTRDPTGWIRQSPHLGSRLKPIPGIITARDVGWARKNWDQACTRTYEYAVQRLGELGPLARMHRDPFEAIMPVLTAKSPLRVYKKIGDEILRDMPDGDQHSRLAATVVRRYLIFRFALHLGIRQRNLRELLVSLPGEKLRTARDLENCRRGELRWSAKRRTWDVFIPAVSMKNGNSSFFKWRPFEITLPDREDLYFWITQYLQRHRKVLLNGRADTGALFVRTMFGSRQNPEYEIHSFYNQWKLTIQRYGIYNPYTKKGAIEGLLHHGPHAVRDVLATHLLKTTGSYELAAFAIQDTVETVMEHYARFLPREKIARAAEELNKVWRR